MPEVRLYLLASNSISYSPGCFVSFTSVAISLPSKSKTFRFVKSELAIENSISVSKLKEN